jgi:uncharacterized protein YraI
VPASTQREIETIVPTIAAVPKASAVVSPFTPFAASTWAANVLLRTSPGYLFPQIAVLAERTSLTVLGRSPGGEWLLVQTTDNRAGWVFAQLVDAGGGNPAEAPLIRPPGVQEVIGVVKDEAGVPISGIQFSLVQGTGNQAPRNDAMTDQSGTFHAFMPATAQGTWDVGFTAVSCKSNTMDANCNCLIGVCGKPYPLLLSLTLPQASAAELLFVWK